MGTSTKLIRYADSPAMPGDKRPGVAGISLKHEDTKTPRNTKPLFRFLGGYIAAILFAASAWAADATRWRPDLQFLATELPRRHIDWFAAANRQQFEAAVAELDAAIPGLTDSDVIVGMARIVALGNDSHTNILLPQQPGAPFRPAGLAFYWFSNGLYVTAAAPELSRALGTRVIRIGDTDVDRAYQAVSSVISHENDQWVRFLSASYLAIPEILRALRIVPEGPTVRYTLEDTRGLRFTMDAAPASASVARPSPAEGFTPVYQRRGNQFYWFEYLDASRTLYFKYNQAAEIPGQPFAGFMRDLFSVFDANPVERIVLDVRNNTGGNSEIITPFAEGIMTRINRTRLFVVIGRQTASTGMRNVIPAKGVPNVLLLGEPTGGKPNAFGDVLTFTLPNSQLLVRYSTRRFIVPEYPGDTFEPDITVPVTAADYFSRHDPVLASILSWQPPSGGPTGAVIVGGLAVVNAASFRSGPLVAPGSLVSAFGNFPGVDGTTGVQVRVNGAPALVSAALPTQINFQIPPQTPLGVMNVEILKDGVRIAGGTVLIVPSDPGLFTLDPQNLSRPGAILNQDNSLNTRTTRARRGDVLQIFGTGLGTATALPRVYMGSEPAEVRYSGISMQYPGLWQINAVVPSRNIEGEAPVFVVLNGMASNAVTVWVED